MRKVRRSREVRASRKGVKTTITERDSVPRPDGGFSGRRPQANQVSVRFGGGLSWHPVPPEIAEDLENGAKHGKRRQKRVLGGPWYVFTVRPNADGR